MEANSASATVGSEEADSRDPRGREADLLRDAMAHTWWGAEPWRRYVRLLALIGPALVVERVLAITDFSRTNAWPILVSLDLGNWLQIVTGSFVAWFPWSLAGVATVIATFATWAGVQTGYASTLVELEHGRPVMVATYRQVGLVFATMLLPLGVAAALLAPLPRPFSIPPILGAAGAWFLVSESLPDDYRIAKIDLVGRRIAEGRATYGDLILALIAGVHVRLPIKWREKAASLLIFIAILGVFAGLWLMVTSRTPWVPSECIVYGRQGQQTTFRGYLLIEGNRTSLILRASDRVVLSLPADLVSTNSTC